MAKITQNTKLDMVLNFSINESEARALDALAGYGDDAFIDVFYNQLGTSYMRDHEQALRQFLKSIREFMPGELKKLDCARAALKSEADDDRSTLRDL